MLLDICITITLVLEQFEIGVISYNYSKLELMLSVFMYYPLVYYVYCYTDNVF